MEKLEWCLRLRQGVLVKDGLCTNTLCSFRTAAEETGYKTIRKGATVLVEKGQISFCPAFDLYNVKPDEGEADGNKI